MRDHTLDRKGWKRVLASVVVTMSVGSACVGQESRGRLMSSLLERYDVDGDGKLSESERKEMRGGLRDRIGGRTPDATVPDSLRQLYRCSPGPHAIESVGTLKLEDGSRESPLLIRVTYPKSTGKFPLIVFSHGAFGSKDAYDPIVRHWASYGYVIIQPTHGDSLSLLGQTERRNVLTSGNPFDVVNIGKHWRSRAEEVALIIESLHRIESKHPAIRGKIDRDHVGVGGHSYGGNTTGLVGGLNFGVDLKIANLDALLMLSPPGPNENANAKMYESITAPVLVVTGTNDKSPRTGQGFEWRLKTYELIPSKTKHLLFIEDAEHNLGGVSGVTGRLVGGGASAAHLTYVKSATTAFWDAYLKSEGAAIEFLSTDQMSATSKQKAKLSRSH